MGVDHLQGVWRPLHSRRILCAGGAGHDPAHAVLGVISHADRAA